MRPISLKEIISYFESFAPAKLQESYDNSGLLIGRPETEISKALITLDITDEVMKEAIESKCNLIIAHHPIIFKGLKKLTGANLVERLVEEAIKNDIAIYAIHTNLDNIEQGVNGILASKLNIKNTRILSPGKSNLYKVITFCPVDHMKNIQDAMFAAGAGHIGNYDSCSYYTDGSGTFRALEGTNPFVGNKNELHTENEYRMETIVPDYNLNKVISAMIKAHPYEEPAYDIYKLENQSVNTGSGMIGTLEVPTDITEYLTFVKDTLGSSYIKHNMLVTKPVERVAICGGSGSFLIDHAARNKADIFITSDIKYHDYFEYQGSMTIADAGHFETEQPVKELIYSLLKKNFPNFALQISKQSINPVSFL